MKTSGSAAEPARSAVLSITYFTDPLCCWSWGFEPQWRLLRTICASRLAWRTRMGGMIRNWSAFEDPVNSIRRPAQMGPLWMQAERTTGMPMDPRVWHDDPPDSSWPACRAFKTAELQSAFAGDLYLRRMRRAFMVEGRNIARREILLELAEDCGLERPEYFDAERFAAALDGAEASAAFRQDIREARYLRIGRFPALVLHRTGSRPKLLTGWRPFADLFAQVAEIAPEADGATIVDLASAIASWREMTRRESDEFTAFYTAAAQTRPGRKPKAEARHGCQ